MMIKYQLPTNWFKYDPLKIVNELIDAKSAVMSLTTIPYQRSWVDRLQVLQLKREIAGTSRIEGADFTDRELEAALGQSPEELHTRSQRQARAAVITYRWIAALPDDLPIDTELIRAIHRMIVKDADDDHCAPGQIRAQDDNVVFGTPPHRGIDGGTECEKGFELLGEALRGVFQEHDLLVQALALHYHFGAMHPFLDGNGRTARALEALMLQRAGLKDTLFIAMSNYYYDEKIAYLKALSDVRAADHDLTPFIKFGLKGIAVQCNRLFKEIRESVSRALFRTMMNDLFNRLETPKKRVIARRQLEILNVLLEEPEVSWLDLHHKVISHYSDLKDPVTAMFRDLSALINLGAITYFLTQPASGDPIFRVNLDWPAQITDSQFFERLKKLPKAKPHSFRI